MPANVGVERGGDQTHMRGLWTSERAGGKTKAGPRLVPPEELPRCPPEGTSSADRPMSR